MSTLPRVGFIGLGIMGSAMAKNLQLPVTEGVRALMEKSARQGNGGRDLSVVVETLGLNRSRQAC